MTQIIGQPHSIKKVNIDIIEEIIAENGPISKPELAKITSLSLPTVNKIVDALRKNDRIKVADVSSTGIGRKAQFYVINENLGYILALYFRDDADSYNCAVVNAVGDMIYQCFMPVDTSTKASALESTFRAIDDLLVQAGNNAKAIGIGMPSVVKKDQTLSNIPDIPEWESLNLKEHIEAKYGIPTFIDNDVNLLTVGFYQNELKQQYHDLVYIYLGKGVGSGIIINKKLHKGFKGFAGEIGYLIVEKPLEDQVESVKAKGLLEQKICALIQEIKQAPTAEEKSRQKDKLLDLLAFSLNNLICILNPEVIALKCEIIDAAFISALEAKLAALFHREHLPVFLNDPSQNSGIFGIVNMCVANISSKLQLVKGVGV
ncbi:MAG: ROK family protein [Desulfobacteraceae bacterium]|nr:MAG: ROK family protein [Desulfobacteraceae bacterium]